MTRRNFLASASLAPALLATPQQLDESGFTRLEGWSVQDGPESAFYFDVGQASGPAAADIVVHESSGYPAWLRSPRQYENFDFRGEFFVKGWCDSGIYIHAPEHGRPMWCGMEIHIFHQVDERPSPESMGAIFPVRSEERRVGTESRRPWWRSPQTETP